MKKKKALPDIASVHHKFLSTGKINADSLRKEIKDSWIRSRKLGIDPNDGSSPTILNEPEFTALLSKKKDLLTIAIPFMKRLYDVISYSGFAVVLSDEQGFILEIVSTPDLEESVAETNVNFKAGVRWLEEDVGTNGIDLVLRLKKPYQISGAEHYAITHHPVSCIGAPIFNADGQLTGTLTASGFVQATQKHTLAMIVAAVEVITDEIMIREKNNQLTITNNRLTNVLMSMSDGVIVTDSLGVIQQMNPIAKQMLGQSIGMEYQAAISDFYDDGLVYRNDVLKKGMSYTDKEVAIKSKTHSTHTLATANPIKDEQEQIVGGIIVLTPAAKVQKLIKRYASTSARFHFKDIIGRSSSMQSALDLAERASRKSNTILLEGESGTGKEIFAQAIHNNSNRENDPFVVINCGALPRELISSELFGYMEGTFTGAKKEGRPGKFELANGGTIFLDEVAEMPLEQQVNLLRVLQERAITRIGSIKEIPIDVMIICATNKDLKSEVMRNNFRQDLYYRLNVISVKIPPLRERLEDIPLLVNFFIASMSNPDARSKIIVAPEVIECFNQYNWPGNVRELQNVIEKMLLYCEEGELGLERLPAGIPLYRAVKASDQNMTRTQPDFLHSTRKSKKDKMYEEERQKLFILLSRSGGNISSIAKEMGVNRCTIYRKMKRYNMICETR
jgi:transcriptional regulator of acetoin/glycerol metabolism